MKKLLKFFGITVEHKREVLMLDSDRDAKVCRAFKTHDGWIAEKHPGSDYRVILYEDGTTSGNYQCRGWIRHSGWDGSEKFSDKTSPVR